MGRDRRSPPGTRQGVLAAMGETIRPLQDWDDMVGRDKPGIQPWRWRHFSVLPDPTFFR
jgi:hypothetical protein